MLESLQIENFAIIDRLQLEFDSGLSVLTGETGAGKSILLDAIKLIAGDRADSDSIKSGAERAELSACFQLDRLDKVGQWLTDNEMAADGECVIRRVLYANGRSKAFINGYSATLGQLRALCDQLIDIHGQHEHQSLQKPPVQRQLLDSFLAEPELLAQVRDKAQACHALEDRLQQASSGVQAREQRIDLLSLYCEELNQLNLREGEYETLQGEYRKLSNAGQLVDTCDRIVQRLYDHEEYSVQAVLSQCVDELDEMRGTDASLDGSHELVSGALIQIQEATVELRSYRDAIELDESSLEAVNERIAQSQNLARKHHVEVAALPELAETLTRELQSLQSDDYDLDRLQLELEKAREDYHFSAGELSHKRQHTAAMLSEQITAVMQQLGMEGGRFVIDVEADNRISSHGLDNIGYLVSANPGQPPRSLARVASGGELSRISLAIQVIMSESSRIPTLIFDEVDAGVGGGVAEIVGKKLRLLGSERQVLCVTHLPQVASQAHRHYRVEKSSTRGETTTRVASLNQAERLEEVARMLGGVKITAQTRAHASEMIESRDR